MDLNDKSCGRGVIFVDDSRVQKITNLDDNENGKGRTVRECRRLTEQKIALQASRASIGQVHDLPPLEEEDDDDFETEDGVLCKPTELLEDQSGVKGSSIYGFSTPRKRTSMLEKAGSAKKTHVMPATPKTPTTPRTPKVRNLEGSRTPRTPKSSSKCPVTTPKRRRSTSEEPKTPHTLRKRVKQRIKKIVCEEESSSSSEEVDESDSDCHSFTSESDDSDDGDDDKENDDFVTPRRGSSHFLRTPARKQKATPLAATPARTPSRSGRGRKMQDVEMVAKADDYFMHQNSSKKITTSDHTLNHLQTPRLSPEDLQILLSDTTLSHQEERKNLIENHICMFSQWMTYLCEDFSIFLYGLGSKKALLNVFQQQYLGNFDHMVVNGFFPSLTLKSMLNTITEDILDHVGTYQSYQDQLEFIVNAYSNKGVEPFFLIIHNLDGPMLRAEKTQTAIARLASLPSVHVLASIDHINAPLIFDGGKMSYYNALWYDATTLSPYSEETSYENSLLVQQSGALALSSLIHVFKSLTPNAKGIFLLLTKYQLDQKDNSSYAGLSFNDMYQRCREAFLVNSDLTLRAQLTEFKDHKLIRSKKGVDGIESLLIPLDSSTLEDFISQQDQ